MNEVNRILEWFKTAKPEPTVEDACVQVGCHYEEVEEMQEALSNFDYTDVLSTAYKSKHHYVLERIENLKEEKKIELLDSLCDQIVTAIGVGYMLNMDIAGALDEVIASNHSKFIDGKAVFNEQGKIAKGKNYFEPKLGKFINE